MQLPTTESLARRVELANLLRPLQRVCARVPFFHLAAHRVPTLWTLYRGLLRAAPTPIIRTRVSELFRANRHLTSLKQTKRALLQGHKWLDIFNQADKGDSRLRRVLLRYDCMLTTKYEKERWERLLLKEAAWQRQLRNRPKLTGSYLRPTLYNRPLPRLKPQPEAISMMIKKRRDGREQRMERMTRAHIWFDDIWKEKVFEEVAIELDQRSGTNPTKTIETHFSGKLGMAWAEGLKSQQRAIQATFNLDEERLRSPYSAQMLQDIARARRARYANKRREREREKRGEVLRQTIHRRNKGPPAHVLSRMTPAERQMDKVVRSVSEVGYVGMIKRRLGWRLRNPDAWKAEYGKPEDRARLDQAYDEIRRENLRRRQLHQCI